MKLGTLTLPLALLTLLGACAGPNDPGVGGTGKADDSESSDDLSTLNGLQRARILDALCWSDAAEAAFNISDVGSDGDYASGLLERSFIEGDPARAYLECHSYDPMHCQATYVSDPTPGLGYSIRISADVTFDADSDDVVLTNARVDAGD